MAVPSYQELMHPLLKRSSECTGETTIAEIEESISSALGLSADDLSATLPSGKQTIFRNRLHWAKTYLAKAGALAVTRHGHFKIADRGRQLLSKNLTKIDKLVLAQFPEFVAWKAAGQTSVDETESPATVLNPEESMAVNAKSLTDELSSELLGRIQSLTPAFFENLIVDLLLAMGYGGGRAEMGKALGRSGDGGIDGVIKEDELGLDVIYLQAKRYAKENGIPVSLVRDFVGSLEGHRATKGVFVTTSYFPESAKIFVGKVSKRVTLIDGPELARLMIRHKVGVRTKDTYEINKVDEDYFAE